MPTIGSFTQHAALLAEFLRQREVIVEGIESRLLNVQAKPLSRSRDRREFERALDACFFESSQLARSRSSWKGQLAAARVEDGLEPVALGRQAHVLDPLELIVRAYEYWDQHRWPGRNGRLTFANTLHAVFVLRWLEDLSLRVWDEGHDQAAAHVGRIQELLDRLNEPATPNAFVRDARWLIQTAQGPLTRHLEPYFRIAEHISESFEDGQRLELHKAGAKLAGGHLRSQLRYRASEMRKPADDPEILAIARNSNSMDVALLVRDLVALLETYESARAEEKDRRDLADAILQGLSADPELLLTRLDLLAPATMIEEIFIDASDPGAPRYTARGDDHVRLVARYSELVADLAGALLEDVRALNPGRSAYSPLGISYGFCADLFSNMAMSTLVREPSSGLSLEDTFVSSGRLEEKHARATAWERLPTREGECEHFGHSIDWAQQVFDTTMAALEARRARGVCLNASNLPAGRLFVVPRSGDADGAPGTPLPDGLASAQEHCLMSDLQRALAVGAAAFPKSHIVSDRKEGRFLASGEIDGKWFGVSKMVLTIVKEGRDAVITDVPPPVMNVLQLICPSLINTPRTAEPANPRSRDGETRS